MPESLREKISEEIYLCKYVDLDRSMCLELADKILFLLPQATEEVGYFMPMKLKEEMAEKDKRIAELEEALKKIIKHDHKCDDSCGYAQDIAQSALKNRSVE